MKPERIQFAPWTNEWQASTPFFSKAFFCASSAEAQHYAAHIERIADIDDSSEVKTSISEDFVVVARIFPLHDDNLTAAQEDLGQRIDEALHYLQQTQEALN